MIHLFDRGNNFVTTIPDPIITSYQKANRSLWSMKFSLHSSNPLIPKIEPMFFVDLEDDSGEYIGKFRVLPTQEVVNQSTNEIEYTCHHAFHTLLDSVIFEEKEFEDVQPAVVMKWLLDRQKTPHWIYVDSPNLPNVASIIIEKQTGLLQSAYDVLEALPVQYYFDFDTTVMPWRVSIKESTSVSSRLKEGYNLDSFEITKDPSVLINRLYLESSYYDEEQNKDVLVTLKEANNGVLYLENSDLVDTYGPIEWYEKVDGIKTSAGLKKYGADMLAHISGLVTTIRGDGYDFLKIMDPPIDIDTLRIGRKVFFETEDHGTYYLYVTEEAKSDVFGAPHSISITLSLTGDNKTSASVTKSIFSNIKNAKKTAINALISADGKSLNTYSPYEPDYGNEGDTWFRENTDGSIDILIYKNGDWQEETSKAIFKKVQDQLDTSAKDIEDARLEAEKASLEAENAAKGLIELDTNITNVIAEVNAATERLGTAEEDIANVLSDLDPLSTDPSTTAFKINETKSSLEGISARLVDYAKTTDLEGLATETYALNIAKTEAGKVSQALASYAKTTDVDGKIQSLTENVNSQISTVEGNYTTLSQKFSQIGGRNYLLNSDVMVDFEEQDVVPTTVEEYLPTEGGKNYFQKIKDGTKNNEYVTMVRENGRVKWTQKTKVTSALTIVTYAPDDVDDYILSFKSNTNENIRSFVNTPKSGTKYNTKSIIDKGDYYLVSLVMKAFNVSDILRFYGTEPFAPPQEVEFWDFKLEKGNIATDWTPAPEDFNNLKGKNYALSQPLRKENTLSLNGSFEEDDFIGLWLGNDKFVGFLDNKELTFDLTENYDDEFVVVKTLSEKGIIDNAKLEKGNIATDWTPAPEDIEAEMGALGKDIEDVQADADSKIQTLTENVNAQISTAEGNYTTLAQKVNDQVTKLTSISQTVDGQQTVIADLKGETGLMSLSNIRQSIDEHKSQLVSLAESSMSQVKVDAKEVPIVPYHAGQLWAKGFYDFTQGYDVIKETDTVTLGEFANAGLFRAKNDRLEGGFEWNDWERVSADPRFQMSDITQRVDSITSTVVNNEQKAMSQIRQIANEITSTVKEGDLLSTINQQAGNVLIQVGTKSKLNITEAGTYMNANFVKSSHIADAAITTAKIGNAQIIGAKIANATITSAKIASLDVAKISGKISNFIQSNWNAINSSISITGTQLVASHTDGTKTILDATGLYTQVGSSKYKHSYLMYANHALKLNNGLDKPRKITLPAIWKGRKFEVMVSLASTDGFVGLSNDYVLRRITVGHNINTRDFKNATFEMYGYAEYVHITTKNVVQRYVDARYLVVQTF